MSKVTHRLTIIPEGRVTTVSNRHRSGNVWVKIFHEKLFLVLYMFISKNVKGDKYGQTLEHFVTNGL